MTTKTNQISRFGSYAVVLRDFQILFTQKKSGPYKGLWGLPGGAIEFGETPEEALRRELLEETALDAGPMELLLTATSNTQYNNQGTQCHFHHIGIIYKVSHCKPIPGLIPEEAMRWIDLDKIPMEELTPFAKQVLSERR